MTNLSRMISLFSVMMTSLLFPVFSHSMARMTFTDNRPQRIDALISPCVRIDLMAIRTKADPLFDPQGGPEFYVRYYGYVQTLDLSREDCKNKFSNPHGQGVFYNVTYRKRHGRQELVTKTGYAHRANQFIEMYREPLEDSGGIRGLPYFIEDAENTVDGHFLIRPVDLAEQLRNT